PPASTPLSLSSSSDLQRLLVPPSTQPPPLSYSPRLDLSCRPSAPPATGPGALSGATVPPPLAPSHDAPPRSHCDRRGPDQATRSCGGVGWRSGDGDLGAATSGGSRRRQRRGGEDGEGGLVPTRWVAAHCSACFLLGVCVVKRYLQVPEHPGCPDKASCYELSVGNFPYMMSRCAPWCAGAGVPLVLLSSAAAQPHRQVDAKRYLVISLFRFRQRSKLASVVC
ncbi:unnamed protein product, partial [Urochloa humidicola]